MSGFGSGSGSGSGPGQHNSINLCGRSMFSFYVVRFSLLPFRL